MQHETRIHRRHRRLESTDGVLRPAQGAHHQIRIVSRAFILRDRKECNWDEFLAEFVILGIPHQPHDLINAIRLSCFALHAERVSHGVIAPFEEAFGEGFIRHCHLGGAHRVPSVEIAARQKRGSHRLEIARRVPVEEGVFWIASRRVGPHALVPPGSADRRHPHLGDRDNPRLGTQFLQQIAEHRGPPLGGILPGADIDIHRDDAFRAEARLHVEQLLQAANNKGAPSAAKRGDAT